jgi:hypothetical protein
MDECSNVNKFQDCHITSHVTSIGKASQLQEVEVSSIYKESAHGGGKVFSPTHRPSLPPEDIPVSHFC